MSALFNGLNAKNKIRKSASNANLLAGITRFGFLLISLMMALLCFSFATTQASGGLLLNWFCLFLLLIANMSDTELKTIMRVEKEINAKNVFDDGWFIEDEECIKYIDKMRYEHAGDQNIDWKNGLFKEVFTLFTLRPIVLMVVLYNLRDTFFVSSLAENIAGNASLVLVILSLLVVILTGLFLLNLSRRLIKRAICMVYIFKE